MQAEGFTLIEGTNEGAAAPAATKQSIENTTMPTMPEDEIAWETVKSVAPAAEASMSAAPGAYSPAFLRLHSRFCSKTWPIYPLQGRALLTLHSICICYHLTKLDQICTNMVLL